MKKLRFSENTRRIFKYGSNSIVLIILAIVAAVVLNLVLEKFSIKIDITTQKLYSISDDTKEILGKLDKEVYIYGLFDRTKAEADSRSQILNVLDNFDKFKNVKISYIDPLSDPSFIRNTVGESKAGDFGVNDFIVKSGDKVRQIKLSDMYESQYNIETMTPEDTGLKVDRTVTSAILYVSADSIPVVYFSTGNGEVDWKDYTKLQREISLLNFDIKNLDITANDIPKDANIIIFKGPQYDLSKIALDKLEAWFQSGGNAIFMMDPLTTANPLENFNKLFSRFNLSINNDLVNESTAYSYPNQPSFFQSMTKTEGPLSGIKSFPLVIFNTRSINLTQVNKEYTTSEALIKTSAESISLSAVEDNKNPKIGVLNVIAFGEYTGGYSKSRVLITGSSFNVTDEFILNTGAYGVSALKLYNYSFNWMYQRVNEGDLIVTKELRSVGLKRPTQDESNLIGMISVIIIPVTILIIGGVVWFRRRHL